MSDHDVSMKDLALFDQALKGKCSTVTPMSKLQSLQFCSQNIKRYQCVPCSPQRVAHCNSFQMIHPVFAPALMNTFLPEGV